MNGLELAVPAASSVLSHIQVARDPYPLILITAAPGRFTPDGLLSNVRNAKQKLELAGARIAGLVCCRKAQP